MVRSQDYKQKDFIPPWPENKSVCKLLKFGAREHMRQLWDEGVLFMRPLEDYKSMEGDSCRHDRNEGVGYVYNDVNVTLGDLVLSPKEDFERCTWTPDGIRWNVYCMFSIQKDAGCFNLPLIDPRNFEFGDTAAIITDATEFLNRVKRSIKLNSKSQNFAWWLVKYIDFTESEGIVGPFRKDKKYSYQNEFRIAVQALSDIKSEPLFLRLGSLRDIVSLHDIKSLNAELQTSLK